MTTKIKIEIKSFWGKVLFESERDTIKEALQDAVLQGAVLQDAVLRGADLRGAVLQGAVLQGVVLQGADLRGADLRGADLRGAVLRGADLQDAVLRGADLRGADLRGAVLQGVVLQGAVLQGADLQGAVLQGAVLQGADLRGAVLQGADLQGAVLQGAVLRGVVLRGVSFDKLPQDFINQCSRDILFIFNCLKKELPAFKEKLLAGEIDGSQYTGECTCLVGTFAKIEGGENHEDVEKVCAAIPYYEMGTQNMGETWFLNIRKGDTPENNEFSKHVLHLLEMAMIEK